MLRFSRVILAPALTRRAVAVSLSAAPCRVPLIASPLTARDYHTSRPLLAAGQPPEARGAATAASSSSPTAPAETSTQHQQQYQQGTSAEATSAPVEKPVKGERAPPADSSSSSSPPADGRPAPQQSQGSTVADVMAGPESAMRRLFASWQQGVVASIGAVMGIGFLLYFLYTPVKEDTVHHTAVVASEALADARLKGQAVQLSKDVVLEVLRDPKSLDAAVDVVVQLLGREETKIAVSSLLQSLFEDHYTQEVTKKFVLQVVQDPWIQDQLQGITEEQVRKLLRNPELKASLSDFLLHAAVDSLEKPQFHYEVARAIRHSAASVFNFWQH